MSALLAATVAAALAAAAPVTPAPFTPEPRPGSATAVTATATASAPASPVPVAAPPAPAGAPARFRILEAGRWGYIDASGKVVIAPRFARAADFSEGLAAVLDGKTFGYVDPAGKMVLVPPYPPERSLHRPFLDGRAVVTVGARDGAIDREGRLAIPARFDSIEDYSEGYALACDEEGCGWIDPAGRRRLGPAGMGGTPMRGGVATGWMAMGMGRKRAFLFSLDAGGLPEEYEETGNHAEGLVPVRLDRAWGYADSQGRPSIPLQFAWAGDFSGGLAPARKDRLRCGYIDRTGAFAVPERFRECRPFAAGLARVDLGGESDAPRVGFIDRAGKVVIVGREAEPPFDTALDFVNGLAAVGQGGAVATVGPEAPTGPRLGYVDRTGRYVWKPTR